MANGTGTATIDFGAAPGSNLATIAVTGQASITTGSHVEAWLQGDTSADHNAYEHTVVSMRLRCGDLISGTGFTIYSVSEQRLAGVFTVHWVWST